jgi:hypothetical protein
MTRSDDAFHEKIVIHADCRCKTCVGQRYGNQRDHDADIIVPTDGSTPYVSFVLETICGFRANVQIYVLKQAHNEG